ncbi:sulfite exporter TauE/SafE family protein [Aurantimonas sp. VKM B-3413]|uniref:sulfite exporter TauE/SafE family protein n=1 Tax=Aurantimonas sp. VKM B-3413 TaxID=2779401 RepID=UPI001E3FD09B|nr:sulfite exporter TauE/SafE family protein [Aurantimonas sp. VKM B-3413]MCB8836254.1 sulfite exporter TauE/SafE family protein [Aurantimonas sp. VKM B-3413]
MQISDLDLAGLSLLAAIFILGGMVKGALGFGLPLTTMAILPLFVPVDFALAVNALVLPLTNVAQFVQARRMRETVRRFQYVLGGIVLGVPIGATLVSLVSDNELRIALGCFVLIFIALTIGRPSFAIAAGVERPVGAGVGFAAGIVGALTTANGPLFVMYLVGLKVDRQLFVSALSLLFIVSGVLISGTFLANGLIDRSRLLAATLAVPASLAGMAAGSLLADRISAEKFRMAVLFFLAILALNMLAQGAAEL